WLRALDIFTPEGLETLEMCVPGIPVEEQEAWLHDGIVDCITRYVEILALFYPSQTVPSQPACSAIDRVVALIRGMKVRIVIRDSGFHAADDERAIRQPAPQKPDRSIARVTSSGLDDGTVIEGLAETLSGGNARVRFDRREVHRTGLQSEDVGLV